MSGADISHTSPISANQAGRVVSLSGTVRSSQVVGWRRLVIGLVSDLVGRRVSASVQMITLKKVGGEMWQLSYRSRINSRLSDNCPQAMRLRWTGLTPLNVQV